MTETKVELHEKLKFLDSFSPTLKLLFTEDVSIFLSDREKVIMEIPSQELNFVSTIGADGHLITEKDPMYDVIRRNKSMTMNVPKEVYGTPFKLVMVPITDDFGNVIGCLGISSSMKNKTDLVQVAEQFAASSEEIGAATEELSTSAKNLSTNMNEVAEAQQNLSAQVENSTKILEMINNVAKNTRILGFNAGIEAARSGEHGKGFSVVAREITKLADQSAESVNEIRLLLDSMKEKVKEVASTIDETLLVTSSQTSAIIEISQSIQHLTKIAEDIDELTQKI